MGLLGEPLEMNFLDPDDSNLPLLAERLDQLGTMIRGKSRVRSGQYDRSNFTYPSTADWPALDDTGVGRDAAFTRALEAFDGTFRPNSPDLMFNLCPSPLIDSVALAALTTQVNPNAIWDLISGKFGLLEERCVRKLAMLGGWGRDQDIGGIFTTGGKATLLYAIKHGLRRCWPDSSTNGVPAKVRVLVSPYAHYSVESVCNWLGFGRSGCHRVAADADGELDPVALEGDLRRMIADGYLVPAVVASAGSLIDMRVDDIAAIRRVIDRVVNDCGLAYTPHLHVDAVVTWPWLAVDDADEWLDELRAPARERVLAVSRRLAGISRADSFGVDFHKAGLAAYSSSCYVTREMATLRALEQPDVVNADAPLRQGDRPVYQWSLENSRPCTGIVMADFVLNRLGRSGLSEYVCRLVSVSDRLRQRLEGPYRHLGSVINPSSLGLDIVVRFNFAGLVRGRDDAHRGGGGVLVNERVCAEFREWLASSDYARTRPVPVIGYVPRYRDGLPAFLLLPSSLYSDERSADAALAALVDAVQVFGEEYSAGAATMGVRLGAHPVPPR